MNVVNIKYDHTKKPKVREMPDCVPLTIPEGIMRLKDNDKKFLEEVEYFVYTSLTRKFGVEICFCQIYLP